MTRFENNATPMNNLHAPDASRTFLLNGENFHAVRRGSSVQALNNFPGKEPFRTAFSKTFDTVRQAKRWMLTPTLA